MLAIDTNIVVRYLTGDHPEQSARAKRLIDRDDVYLCSTVILEAEWVLRSVYGFAPAAVARALRNFAGLPHVTLEDPSGLATALQWAEQGMDFADALHLTGSGDCEAFITFDARLARRVNAMEGLKARAP